MFWPNSTESTPNPADPVTHFAITRQLGVLYVSFLFFSKQLQKVKVQDALKVMNESQADQASQILKPIPEDETVVRQQILCTNLVGRGGGVIWE